jgi:hypothetical protein
MAVAATDSGGCDVATISSIESFIVVSLRLFSAGKSSDGARSMQIAGRNETGINNRAAGRRKFATR